MLKPIVLAAFIFGLCSPSFAASPALFGDLFGDDSSFATINTTGHHARPHSASATNRAGGRLSIAIDITTQQMIVADGDDTIFSFDVSTGRKGHATPTGHFRPVRMNKIWYSSKYENAPMPWSIFFHGGYAIHGTTDVKHLGHVASHGCVRLHPENAKMLYDLVQQYGMGNTDVILYRS
jgi:lipoprotein-anchoring transpeptidase ErfK/SrfK